MSMVRAGGITTLILAALATAALTMFGQWYAAYDLGEVITRVLFWGAITVICMAPIGMVIFPVMHEFLGGDEPFKPLTFALVGGMVGFLIAGYLVWRFRNVLLSSSFLAAPFFVLIGLATGFIGGFVFEFLARERRR